MNDFYNGKKVWVTGHKGMLGNAMVRHLQNSSADILLTERKTLDLTDHKAVLKWAENNRPDYVFHIAAKVGGIYANSTFPADFIRENIMIQTSVLDACYKTNVKKLIFVASNCAYPTFAENPIGEDALFSGKLDENIRYYAISKIAGMEMCRAYSKQHNCNYISIIPPNLYGIGDNYHPTNGHVVAGIIRRAHEAKLGLSGALSIWGDGTPRRELLNVEDLATAMQCIMENENKYDLYNIGVGKDLTILNIAKLISEAIGYKGDIILDKTKPNGTMRKLLDNSRIKELGWTPKISELEGFKAAYTDFLSREAQ